MPPMVTRRRPLSRLLVAVSLPSTLAACSGLDLPPAPAPVQPTVVSAPPEAPAPATLVIQSVGPLRLELDGRDVGRPPLTLPGVPPGAHELVMVTDAEPHAPRVLRVELSPGETRHLLVGAAPTTP